MTDFLALFTEHVAMAYARQVALGDFLSSAEWTMDFRAGVVRFEEKGGYPIQILGSELRTKQTWLWAWGNKDLKMLIDSDLLRDARRMQSFGQEHAIPELTEAKFSIENRANGDMLSLLSTEICGADCSFHGVFDGSAVYYLLYDLPFEILPMTLPRITTVITQVTKTYQLSHRQMIEAFLTQQSFEIEEDDGKWTVTHPDGRKLQISFKRSGKIKSIEF
jgi:hypothetical protein